MKRSTALGLLYLLGLACFIGLYAEVYFFCGYPIHFQGSTTLLVLSMLVGGLGLWAASGVVPLIVWAFMSFRRERLRVVAICWAFIMVLLAMLSYLGMVSRFSSHISAWPRIKLRDYQHLAPNPAASS
jgi:hypothetical protein